MQAATAYPDQHTNDPTAIETDVRVHQDPPPFATDMGQHHVVAPYGHADKGSAPDLLGGGPLSRKAMDAFAEECAQDTLRHLLNGTRLTEQTYSQVEARFQAYLLSRRDENQILDLLAYIVSPQEDAEYEAEQHSKLDQWSRALIESMGDRRIARLPFLNCTRAPSIYRSYPTVFQFCDAMMAPIVQAHEKDIITVASINAVTSMKVAAVIAEMIEEECGRPPIAFVTVAPSKQWKELNRKHFGR